MSAYSLYFLNPAFDETIAWITGIANYTYTLVILLFFLLPYRLLRKKNLIVDMKAIFSSIFMLILGVLAGWGNENTSSAAIGALFLGFVYFVWKQKTIRLPLWTYTGFLGLVVGFLFQLFAPGNQIRSSGVLEQLGGTLNIILQRIKNMERAVFDYMWVPILVWILLILFLRYYKSYTIKNEFVVYSILSWLSWGVMVAAPSYPPRATFGSIMFFIIAIGCMSWDLILEASRKDKRIKKILLVACYGAFICFVIQNLTNVGITLLG